MCRVPRGKTKEIVKVYSIVAVDDGGARQRFAEVCVEDCVSIEVNSVPIVHLKITPDDLEAFAIGHLVCEGIVPSFEAIDSIAIEYPVLRVSVREIDDDALRAPMEVRSAGAGLRSSSACEGPPLGPGIEIDVDTLFEGTRLVHHASPIWRRTGGTHCTVILDRDGSLVSGAEDIGRHNSIDKAVGKALMQGVDPGRCFMVCTGRLPADMVAKAYHAGVTIMVSNNAPFSSGIELAERVNMTIAGFARPPRASIYTHPERIIIPVPSGDAS